MALRLHSYSDFLCIIKFKEAVLLELNFLGHKLRIIGHVNENNWNNFQVVQNRIIGRKLSTIASCLLPSLSEYYNYILYWYLVTRVIYYSVVYYVFCSLKKNNKLGDPPVAPWQTKMQTDSYFNN